LRARPSLLTSSRTIRTLSTSLPQNSSLTIRLVGQSSSTNSTSSYVSVPENLELNQIPLLDAGTSIPKRGIRTTLELTPITSVWYSLPNSSLHPYEPPF
jgi:hypothetical protein